MTLKHFEASKSVKNQKIVVKSQNYVKSACFWHGLYHNSAIFEDIELKFCTHIHQSLRSNILYIFFRKKNSTSFHIR